MNIVFSILICILLYFCYKHYIEIKKLKRQFKDFKFDLELEKTTRLQQYRELKADIFIDGKQ